MTNDYDQQSLSNSDDLSDSDDEGVGQPPGRSKKGRKGLYGNVNFYLKSFTDVI